MTQKGILLTVTAAFVICAAPAAAHEGDSATQTDWSGGDGVTGPVTDWSDTFDSSVDISWMEFPGELHLSSTPLTTPVEHNIDGDLAGANSVFTADFDGDSDMDVLCAAYSDDDIVWYENADGSGTVWVKNTIDDNFDNLRWVRAANVDGDTDIDVLAAGGSATGYAWWENVDGSGTSWTKHVIDDSVYAFGAASIYAVDVDGDTDLDAVGAAATSDDIAWYENVDGSGTSWTRHTIDGSVGGAESVCTADIDGDTYMDVIGAAYDYQDHAVIWWRNLDGTGTSWAEYTVDGEFRPYCVYAADVDGDDDIDILGAAKAEDDITWWENADGSGTSWTEHNVDSNFDGAFCIYAEDVDGDSDIDILGAAEDGDDITWWENVNGSGTSWTERIVDGNFGTARSVYAADVDGDDDIDVLGAARSDNDVTWWEVTGFNTSGDLTSSIYDTEGSPEWGEIDWTADAPTDTTVKFQVRSSGDAGDMGDWSSDITAPGSLEGILTNGDRYVQYKAILETTDTGVTPTLEDITIDWGYTDIAVTSFAAESAAGGIEVSWECADPVAGFNLYRYTEGEGKAITPRDKLNGDLITGESPYTYLDTLVEEGETYNYWLEAIDVGGSSETFGPVECAWKGALPTTYALYQSRPNPAPGNAVITFDLPENVKVTLTVYDISGRKVTTVVDETLAVGTHERTVGGLAPGVYVYRLDAGTFSAAMKMVVVE